MAVTDFDPPLTQDERQAEQKAKRDHLRRNAKLKVLRAKLSGLYTVDELSTLTRVPTGWSIPLAQHVYTPADEVKFDQMLQRLEPGREWGCTINHQGACNVTCCD